MDLSLCEREPIHLPGSIQPHGCLLVVDDQLKVVLVSENAARFLFPGEASPDDNGEAAKLIGRRLDDLLLDGAERIEAAWNRLPFQSRPTHLGAVLAKGGKRLELLAHLNPAGCILELEPSPKTEAAPFLNAFEAFLEGAEEAASIDQLAQMATERMRELTGFDRVHAYRFDDRWDGVVIGESRNERLPSYLGHRFPESDIPSQAREIYRRTRLRSIPNANYNPSALVPTSPSELSGQPLDMTFAALRGVSPVHLEYMRNMKTMSSMSIAILRDGKLWGLFSCHHRDAKLAPLAVREACDLLSRAFSLRLAALEHADAFARGLEASAAYSRLLAVMAGRVDFAAGLLENPADLLSLVEAQGAALLNEGGCQLLGETPGEEETRELAAWLFRDNRQEVFATDSLAAIFSPAIAYKDRACGLLSIAISKTHPNYVMWFRPEVVRTIVWGGDPSKPAQNLHTNSSESSAQGDDRADDSRSPRLHPRKSFEAWRETVRLKSPPWRSAEIEAATTLRSAIIGVVLEKAEALAQLNAELGRTNRELESFSYSVSHDLRAPLRHVAGYAEMLKESAAERLLDNERRYLKTIIESSEFAGALVDRLLDFSRLGREAIQPAWIDMNLLVDEARRELDANLVGRRIEWRIGELPAVLADPIMVQLVVRNLLDNAVKYTRGREPAIVEIGGKLVVDTGDAQFLVRDNGVGFDNRYASKLFGVFERLHRMEDFEGTGIGLANVRRIVARHGGQTWAEGVEGQGATFYFTLPAADRIAS